MRRTWRSLASGVFALAVVGALSLGATQALADPYPGPASGGTCSQCHMTCAEAGCLGQCLQHGGCWCLCN